MSESNQLELSELKKIQNRLRERVADFKGCKILVVGDVGLDEYVLGDVKRISPEAPVPVLEVESEDMRVGLAGNVAQNIVSLGGIAHFASVVGQDETGEKLRNLLQEQGVRTNLLVADDQRPTTRKLRVMAEHHHIVRVDYEAKKYLRAEIESLLLDHVETALPQVDGVIIEDYGKGVFTEVATQRIIAMAHEKGKKVLVDPHRTTPLSFYKGADLFKPNKDEAFILSGLDFGELRERPESYKEVAQTLMKELESPHLIMTRGKLGMSLFGEDGEGVLLPTYARQVFDVTGAGDTVLAALGMAWFSGSDLKEACVLANFAAGVVVGKVGCVPCSLDELFDYMDSHPI